MKNIRHYASIGLMLLGLALFCIPGVKAKYIYTSELFTMNLETKTSVRITLDSALKGGMPTPAPGETWYRSETNPQKIGYKRLVLGEPYGTDGDLLPVPVIGNGIFDGWIAKGKDGSVKIENSDIFTGAYSVFVASFRQPIITFHDDEHQSIPAGDLWDGSGKEASLKSFSPVFALKEEQLPVPSYEGETFAGWYTTEPDGSEIRIVKGKTLENRDYDIYARWGTTDTAAAHNSLAGIVQ